ncbi:MAG: VOC family protein [Bdellovibrionaceae bacterium]|nr:VOC family protein [Pseudobdellovibrionaceae bacterium]
MQTPQFSFSPNIALNVRNSDQAISFYTQVLGLTLVDLHPTKNCGAEMKAGPLTLWIDNCSPDQQDHTGKTIFEFKVENLTAALKLLESNGCRLGSETQDKTFTGRMVTDPFGMCFHVFQKIT